MRYLLFIVMFAISCISFSQEVKDDSWTLIYSSEHYGEEWYIRSIYKESYIGLVTVWVKKYGNAAYFDESGRENKLKDGHILYKIDFDCKEHRLRIVSSYALDSEGDVKHSVVGGVTKWDDILPDTVGEYMLEFVCTEY